MLCITFANDWIRIAELWYRKQLLCQLRHNHCPRNFPLLLFFRSSLTSAALIRLLLNSKNMMNELEWTLVSDYSLSHTSANNIQP